MRLGEEVGNAMNHWCWLGFKTARVPARLVRRLQYGELLYSVSQHVSDFDRIDHE